MSGRYTWITELFIINCTKLLNGRRENHFVLKILEKSIKNRNHQKVQCSKLVLPLIPCNHCRYFSGYLLKFYDSFLLKHLGKPKRDRHQVSRLVFKFQRIHFYSPWNHLKSIGRFSDDFKGNRSWSIRFNLFNTRNMAVIPEEKHMLKENTDILDHENLTYFMQRRFSSER